MSEWSWIDWKYQLNEMKTMWKSNQSTRNKQRINKQFDSTHTGIVCVCVALPHAHFFDTETVQMSWHNSSIHVIFAKKIHICKHHSKCHVACVFLWKFKLKEKHKQIQIFSTLISCYFRENVENMPICPSSSPVAIRVQNMYLHTHTQFVWLFVWCRRRCYFSIDLLIIQRFFYSICHRCCCETKSNEKKNERNEYKRHY